MFLKVFRNISSLWVLILGVALATQSFASTAAAQVITTKQGRASAVDLAAAARELSMQDPYARSLLLFIRSNPATLSDQNFFVGLVSYLVATQIRTGQNGQLDCRNAFANEFERRDFYTRALQSRPQIQQVIASKNIPQRFEVSYRITSGAYDFQSATLPLQDIRAIGANLGRSLDANQARNCANQMLQGAQVDINSFPWRFDVVNEAGEIQEPDFPFVRSLQLNATDARTLYEQFGRQLYSIVSYRVLAANDGSHRVQAIATDAQLFGLSDNAVVRIKTYTHPTLSQPNYLNIANQLTIRSDDQGYPATGHRAPLGLDANVTFQQNGFRAVANGIVKGQSTGVTAATSYPVTGSAAVGTSGFIMRIAAPQLTTSLPDLQNVPGAQKYLTLFLEIDFNNVTATSAPVIGHAVVLQVSPDGAMQETRPYRVSGRFIPLDEQPNAEVSQAPDTQPKAAGSE